MGLESIKYTVGWYNIDSTDLHIDVEFLDQFVFNDKPSLWSYSALADKVNTHSERSGIQLKKLRKKL